MSTSLVCASHSPLFYCFRKQPRDWERLQQVFAVRALAIRNGQPELVIVFGCDHFNGFFQRNMPAFCLGLGATATADIGGFAGDLDVPAQLAGECAAYLRQHDIDIAVSRHMTVDHGFSQTIKLMLGDLKRYPLVPVFINCISRPFVPFRRSRLLGEAIGRWVASIDTRVLFLASGGMSHHPERYYPEQGQGSEEVEAWKLSGGSDPASLSAVEWLERLERMHHEGAEMIARGERSARDMRLNPESDQRFLDALTGTSPEQIDGWDQEQLVREAGIGSMELHTWIAAAAAHRVAGGAAPQVDIYTPAPEIGISAGVMHAD